MAVSQTLNEHPLGMKDAVCVTCRTEAPQLVSKDDILWSMDAMQSREVGNLVVYLWKMRWLRSLCQVCDEWCSDLQSVLCIGLTVLRDDFPVHNEAARLYMACCG